MTNDIRIPECLDENHKREYWINYCSNFERFKVFMENVLMYDIAMHPLDPVVIVLLLKFLIDKIVVKFPNIREDVLNWYKLVKVILIYLILKGE